MSTVTEYCVIFKVLWGFRRIPPQNKALERQTDRVRVGIAVGQGVILLCPWADDLILPDLASGRLPGPLNSCVLPCHKAPGHGL